MKIKILIISIALIVLGAGLGYWVWQYFVSEPAPEEVLYSTAEAPENCLQDCKEDLGEVVTLEEPAFEEKETLLVKDEFSLILPPGWQEVLTPPEVLVMAVDAREEMTDEKAKEAGFRTNLSLKNDDLQKYDKDYSVEEYANSIKTSLIQIIPGIEFTYEDQGIINGNDAFFVECESAQEGIDFKTLLVFIKGKDILWAISFNTIKGFWLDYKGVFYQIAESFKLRFKIP